MGELALYVDLQASDVTFGWLTLAATVRQAPHLLAWGGILRNEGEGEDTALRETEPYA